MRILIADDSAIIRRGLVSLLAAERLWTVCGEAANGAETLQKALDLQPDLLLLDICMPDMNGLQVARRLSATLPKIKILVISQNDPGALLPASLRRAGADAWTKADSERTCCRRSGLWPD